MLGRISLFFGLLIASTTVYAMPAVVVYAGAWLVQYGTVAWGLALIVVGTVWGQDEARKANKAREDAARLAYNNALKDRTITTIATDSPHVYIYGRARVGATIVAVLTSGNRDQYKHLVCIHAAHECQEIEEVYINGKALGTLDADGFITNTTHEFVKKTVHTAVDSISLGTSVTLAHTPNSDPIIVFHLVSSGEGPINVEVSYTLVGNLLTVVDVDDYTINYSYNSYDSKIRVKKHLGTVGEAADASLISELPLKWTTAHKLSGYCYTVIRLDLNYEDFQSGIPSIEMLIKGKKLHDVRSVLYPNDVPVYSQNVALMIADYLTSPMCNVPWTDLPLADFIAAANVCDEVQTFGALYTCNGTVSADQSQSQVLEKMAQSMAGTICSTTWGCKAGKYIGPVMSLNQADIVGSMSTASGVAAADLYNGIKGQYISAANIYVPTDFEPYQNQTYITSDGEEFWTNVDFIFTDDKQRVHNLCRIFMEDQRNGFTLKGQFSYKCWDLQHGDRVTFTSTFLGQTSKIYRVINKSYSPETAVELTLKEDVSTIWDQADAVTEDSTPNTDLPNPFIVPAPGNILVSEALYETTSSSGIKVKAIVTWEAPADIYVQDYELTYKPYFNANYDIKIYSINPYVELFDMAIGQYHFKVRARNNLNLYSDYSIVKVINIYGLAHALAPAPSNITGFSVAPFNGSALVKWNRTTDIDVKIGGDVEIRFCPLTTGASWEQSIILPDGNFNGDATNAIVSLGTGTYYAKFKDSTGNYSLTPASFVATEALVSGWTTVATSTQHTTYTGAKTGVVATDNILKLDSSILIDAMGLIDDQGFIDGIGGLETSGTYEFNAILDLTSILSRRFHSHIKMLAYNANDLIDSRLDLIDSWVDFDGSVINGTNATTYISVSDDNITYGSWVPFMVADFNCRYAKFKTILITSDVTHNLDISELSVSVKVPT